MGIIFTLGCTGKIASKSNFRVLFPHNIYPYTPWKTSAVYTFFECHEASHIIYLIMICIPALNLPSINKLRDAFEGQIHHFFNAIVAV